MLRNGNVRSHVRNSLPEGIRIDYTVDTNAAGGLTKREAEAAVDIIDRMEPGDIFIAVPKVDPKKK